MGDPADTVPPPPGEDDAYSAQTRVEALPEGLLEMLRGSGEPSKAAEPAPKPKPAPEPKRPTPAAPSSARASVPRLDEVPDVSSGDDSTEPTLDKPVRFILQAAAQREAAEAAKVGEEELTVARAPDAGAAAREDRAAPERSAASEDRDELARLAGKRPLPAWVLAAVVGVVIVLAAAWLALAR